MSKKITVELSEETVAYLALLDDERSAENVLTHLAQSAADGLRRPGAWERGWLCMAFPQDEFLARIEERVAAGAMVVNDIGQIEWVAKENG